MSIINKIIKNKETKSKEIQKLLDPKKKFTIDLMHYCKLQFSENLYSHLIYPHFLK